MSLNANILAAFDQLGLYEELLTVSLPSDHTESKILYSDMSLIAVLPNSDRENA
jgi:hypothetical protein